MVRKSPLENLRSSLDVLDKMVSEFGKETPFQEDHDVLDRAIIRMFRLFKSSGEDVSREKEKYEQLCGVYADTMINRAKACRLNGEIKGEACVIEPQERDYRVGSLTHLLYGYVSPGDIARARRICRE